MSPFAWVVWAAQKIPWVAVTSADALWGSLRGDDLQRKVEKGRLLVVFKGRAVTLDDTIHDFANLVSYWFRGVGGGGGPFWCLCPLFGFYFYLLVHQRPTCLGYLPSFFQK